MPDSADVYVLAPARDAVTLDRFLARYLPARAEMADEYEVPQYAARPTVVYRHATDLLIHLFARPAEPHAVYWRSTAAGDPDQAMAFFTTDAALILGLSCVPEDDSRWLADLLGFAGTGVGYIDYAAPPPDTVAGFRAIATARTKSSS